MALSAIQKTERSTGIGGSDAPVVAGISPWKTRVQLWAEKTGRAEEPDLDDVEHIRWGTLLENVIAEEAARRKGWKIRRVIQTVRHAKYPFMLANIDRRIVGVREGLEVKNASDWMLNQYGEEESDDIPLYYLMQGIHYCAVFDYDAWNWAVLFGGNKLRFFRLERDAEVEKQLIEVESTFWEENVVGGTPPAPMRLEDLTRLYPMTYGSIQATPEIAEVVQQIAALSKQRRELEKQEKQLKLEVGTFMGENGDLLDPHDLMTTIATYRAHDETRVDPKAVRERLPLEIRKLVDCVRYAESVEISGPPPGYDRFLEYGLEACIEDIVRQMFRTSPVRKFLPKGTR